MRSNRSSVRLAAILACAGAGAALMSAATLRAEPVEMVLGIAAHAPTSPKSAIPGTIPGGAGTQTDPRFTNFNVKSYHSPNGMRWILAANTNLPTPTTAVVVGSGLAISGGALAARDNTTATTAGDFVNTGALQNVPRINDSGQWAMGSGSSAGSGRLIKWDGTSLVTLVAPNDILPGVTNLAGGTFCGATIRNDGVVTFQATADAAGSTTNGPYGVYTTSGGAPLIEVGVTIPDFQPGDAGAPWTTVSYAGFSQNAAGTSWLALGKVGGVVTVAVNNHVKIQVNSTIPNTAFISPVSSILDAYMESNGDWYARGTNVDSTSWVLRNGVVVGATGGEIFPGSTEHWKSGVTIADIRGNGAGHFVITGTTDIVDTSKNMVLVLNAQRVLARMSDPIDPNTDGTSALNLYLHLPQDKGNFLSDGYYMFASRLKAVPTGTTTTLGNNASLLRVKACPANFNGNAVLEVQDIFDYLNAWFAGLLTADFNHTGSLEVQDIFDFLNAWFAGC